MRLFHSIEALQQYVESGEFEQSIDGITLVQQYIEAPEPFITRCEFVGREFLYAVRADTSQGFLLCPADQCQTEDAFCPTTTQPTSKFHIVKNFCHPVLECYQHFIEANGIHIAGIEFILDNKGELYTYDINTNTNYNSTAEARAGISGMRAIAEYLGRELKALTSAGNDHRQVVND